MKAFKLFSMVAMAFIFGACDNEDNKIEQPVQQANGIQFTATIAATNSGAQTRTTYNEDNGQINVAWDVNDEIALLHNGVKDVATVTAVDESGHATISATLTGNPTDGDAVQLVYPASSINADGTPTTAAQYAQLHQDGTLGYIQNNLDGRACSGNLSISGTNASLKNEVNMVSQIAIWKLTLQNVGSNAIDANTVSITIGTTPVAAAANASTKSEWYICYPVAAILQQQLTGDLTISVTSGSVTYIYTKSGGVTLSPSRYYQSTVTMVAVAGPTSYALSESNVGMVVGTDGLAYAVEDKGNLPTGVTAAGMVAYKSGSNGLVIALADEASLMNWSTVCGESGAAAHTPTITGQTWYLPSKNQWTQMFSANGGSQSSYTGLNTAISNAGGTALLGGLYWSSGEIDVDNAWLVDLLDGNVSFSISNKVNNYFVRACLAF